MQGNGSLQQLEALESKRHEAMVSKDLKFLEAVLDDELTYVHSTGRWMTKQEYLDHVNDENFAYLAISSPRDQRASVEEFMAMLIQRLDATMLLHGKEVSTQLSVTAVWRNQGQGWKLIGSTAARIQS